MKRMELPKKLNGVLVKALEQGEFAYETLWLDGEKSRVEEVEYQAREGFLPFTNGGYRVMKYGDLALAESTGSFPPIIGERLEASYEYALDCFAEENPDKVMTDNQVKEEYREEWCDYYSAWLSEGGLFGYEVRALFYGRDNLRNVSGKDEIRVFAGVNTDFEYLRDGGLHTTFERTLQVDGLTPEVLADTIRLAFESV